MQRNTFVSYRSKQVLWNQQAIWSINQSSLSRIHLLLSVSDWLDVSVNSLMMSLAAVRKCAIQYGQSPYVPGWRKPGRLMASPRASNKTMSADTQRSSLGAYRSRLYLTSNRNLAFVRLTVGCEASIPTGTCSYPLRSVIRNWVDHLERSTRLSYHSHGIGDNQTRRQGECPTLSSRIRSSFSPQTLHPRSAIQLASSYLRAFVAPPVVNEGARESTSDPHQNRFRAAGTADVHGHEAQLCYRLPTPITIR